MIRQTTLKNELLYKYKGDALTAWCAGFLYLRPNSDRKGPRSRAIRPRNGSVSPLCTGPGSWLPGYSTDKRLHDAVSDHRGL